jgi:ppGpp synthetase/RelA/SpoT-type nucleotidyltranferase
MTTPLIDDFMDRYVSLYWKKLAKLTAILCRECLGEKIQATITSREKDYDKLREKVERRNAQREGGYKKLEEIDKDIVDRAGVRIVLFFPNQRFEVAKLLKERFVLDGEIIKHPSSDDRSNDGGVARRMAARTELPDRDYSELGFQNERAQASTDEEDFNPHFEDYEAWHARIHLTVEQAKIMGRDWKQWHMVEIQIVSALNHAWAQVTHDITYKKLFRDEEASAEEKKILRAVRAMIGAGDIMFDQLHQKYLARTTKEFENWFELGSFLLRRGVNPGMTDDEGNQHLRYLHDFLRAVGKNTPETLNPILKRLEFEKHQDSGTAPINPPGITNATETDRVYDQILRHENSSTTPSIVLSDAGFEQSQSQAASQSKGTGWQEILKQYHPFQPSESCWGVFCIMAEILSKLKVDDREVLKPQIR